MAVFRPYKLTEDAVDLILNYLQANMKTTLAEVTSYHAARTGDLVLGLEEPRTYLTYESKKIYQKPGILVIAKSSDFHLERGANHINAVHLIDVSCVVEERLEKDLVRKSFRYQAAIAKLLHLMPLDNSDGTVRIVPKVVHLGYSPVYTEDNSDIRGVFIKEVLVQLEVEHWEQLL